MAYTIFKDFEFASAHHIPGHPGKCRHMHGHNYRARVHVSAETLDSLGMVVDFADLKAILDSVVGPFDHAVINDLPPFDRLTPTTEHLAKHIYDGVSEQLKSDDATRGRVRVAKVELWETARSCAIYQP